MILNFYLNVYFKKGRYFVGIFYKRFLSYYVFFCRIKTSNPHTNDQIINNFFFVCFTTQYKRHLCFCSFIFDYTFQKQISYYLKIYTKALHFYSKTVLLSKCNSVDKIGTKIIIYSESSKISMLSTLCCWQPLFVTVGNAVFVQQLLFQYVLVSTSFDKLQ